MRRGDVRCEILWSFFPGIGLLSFLFLESMRQILEFATWGDCHDITHSASRGRQLIVDEWPQKPQEHAHRPRVAKKLAASTELLDEQEI